MAQSFRTNLSIVAMHYMQLLNVPVTKTTLKENLEQNPYYPSLYSLSNVFEKLNIANEAFSVDEETLQRFIPPYITYCSRLTTGDDFVLITVITDTTVSYTAEKNKAKQIRKLDFF